MISRRLQQQARQFADQTSDRIRSASLPDRFYATVSAVSPGGAKDGNALVSVRYRDAQITVAGYNASYTPVIGHRVVCVVIDNQVDISHRSIGHP